MTDRDGVDVASYQGLPGQWKAAAGDIGWAAVKITELSPTTKYVNPDAEGDWEYLKTAGKKRIGYLFAHPGADAAETASFFTGEIRRLGLDDDDMVAVDLETSDGKTPAEVSAWGREVLSYLEHDLDRIPLLYTFLNFAETGNCEGMGHYPLWIADVNSPPGHPRVPAPWTTWAVHQYSQAQPIDRDICAYKSAQAMSDHLGRQVVHTKPVPDPKPKRKPVRKTVKKVATGAKKEPALSAASAASLATVLIGFLQHAGVTHLDPAQVKILVTCVVALAGVVTTAVTTKPQVAGHTTVVATAIAALAGTVGTPQLMTLLVPVIALLAGHHVRQQVSPKNPPAPPAA